MTPDQKVFKEILGYEPDMKNPKDFQTMNSLWFLLEYYNATNFIYDFDLDETFIISNNKIINDAYLTDIEGAQYLRENSISAYGQKVVESLKETLNQAKDIDKTFLFNGIAATCYAKKFLSYKDYTVKKAIEQNFPKYKYILETCQQAILVLEDKIANKTKPQDYEQN